MPLIGVQQRLVLPMRRELLQDDRGGLGELDECALIVLGLQEGFRGASGLLGGAEPVLVDEILSATDLCGPIYLKKMGPISPTELAELSLLF